MFAICRCKIKGKILGVKTLVDNMEWEQLVNLHEGYYIFTMIQNSSAYLEKMKKMPLP